MIPAVVLPARLGSHDRHRIRRGDMLEFLPFGDD